MAKPKGRVAYNREEIVKDFISYCNSEPMPFVEDYCGRPETPCKDTLYEWAKTMPDLTDALKKAKSKSISYLVKGALKNNLQTAMAIFTLKNLGWRDNPQGEDLTESTEQVFKLDGQTFRF